MEPPPLLKKHLEKNSLTYTDKLHLPISVWLNYFFQYALEKKKNFYWAWKSFMIVVRKQKDKLILVLEIPLKKAPFLVQKHVDITNIPIKNIVGSLLFLHHHYESSPMLRRNREHSVRFLSFISFVQMVANHDIKKLPELSHVNINQLLVAYLLKTLDLYNIPIIDHKHDDRLYSISQLTRKSLI